MGVSVESCGQYDLPQAPPCLDGNCLRAGSTADQREGGGGRGHPVPGTGHSASSCFTRILLFLFFFFFFRLWLLPCCGQGLLHIICLSPSNLSSQHLRLRPHRSDQVCLGPIRLLRHLLCRLPAPALHRGGRGGGLEGLQPTCLKATGHVFQGCGGAKLRAKYNFGYKVADEESQAYINHQESREGNDVTGTYNYVNPAGALVTVNYEAGVDGFSQTRDVEQGAVQMRNIPGAWTGPLAGLEEPTSVPATTSSISSRSSSQVSQEALIAQILSSIQPKISSAVQGALSSQTAGRRTVAVAAPRQQPVRVAAPRPIAPRPRPGVVAPSSRRVAPTSSSRGNLGDVFGNGETSVKFATPQFQFEF